MLRDFHIFLMKLKLSVRLLLFISGTDIKTELGLNFKTDLNWGFRKNYISHSATLQLRSLSNKCSLQTGFTRTFLWCGGDAGLPGGRFQSSLESTDSSSMNTKKRSKTPPADSEFILCCSVSVDLSTCGVLGCTRPPSEKIPQRRGASQTGIMTVCDGAGLQGLFSHRVGYESRKESSSDDFCLRWVKECVRWLHQKVFKLLQTGSFKTNQCWIPSIPVDLCFCMRRSAEKNVGVLKEAFLLGLFRPSWNI